jgi:ABC-type cobalamin transport system permease subunit
VPTPWVVAAVGIVGALLLASLLSRKGTKARLTATVALLFVVVTLGVTFGVVQMISRDTAVTF